MGISNVDVVNGVHGLHGRADHSNLQSLIQTSELHDRLNTLPLDLKFDKVVGKIDDSRLECVKGGFEIRKDLCLIDKENAIFRERLERVEKSILDAICARECRERERIETLVRDNKDQLRILERIVCILDDDRFYEFAKRRRRFECPVVPTPTPPPA